MPFKLPKGTFPPLELSKDMEKDISRQVERIISQTISDSERFYSNGKNLPSKKWKHIKTQENNYRVYRQRNVKAKKTRGYSFLESSRFTTDLSTRSMMSMEEEEPEQMLIQKPEHVSSLVCHGSVDGKLDDVLYGIFADDDASWQFKTTYLEEKLDDAKILAKICVPSNADPYRYMAVKWFVREQPPIIGSIIHRRDYLIVEATGMALDSQGRRVSYCFLHSIRLSETHELREFNITRAEVVLCYISHQEKPNSVEMHSQGFSYPRGDLNMNLCAAVAPESIIAAVNVIACSYLKKVLWLVRRKQEQKASEEELKQIRANAFVSHCTDCHRGMNKFGTFLSGSACRLCSHMVCTKYSVTKKLILDAENAITRKPFMFCVKCLHVAKETPASVVVMDQVKQNHLNLARGF